MKQLIEVLNNVNTQLTDVQKTVVSTLVSLQKGTLTPDQANTELLQQLFEAAIPSLSLMALNMRQRVATVASVSMNQTQQSGGPSLSSVQDAYKSAARDTQSLSNELRDATKQPSAPMSAARQRIADIAQGMAENMLGQKLGPDFAKGLQEHREELAKAGVSGGMPTLQGGAVRNEPTPEELRRQADEATHLGLVNMVVGPKGLLSVWFSSDVYPGGEGPHTPQLGVNLYQEDISHLPYERLKEWPEGFYRNATTSALQYLMRTNDVIAVLDFGNLVSEQEMLRQRAVQLIFHSDTANPKRKLAFTHLENDLMKNVIRDLNNRLSALHHL